MESGRLDDTYGGYRARLIEELRAKDIDDIAVLHAFGITPRHLFVPEAFRHRAYEDVALPIGNGQTISQPSTQAKYLVALRLEGRERVLEVGTGSGYQAALLSHLAATVISIERVPELASTARRALAAAGVRAVTVITGDGSLGWSAEGPYDAILVGAVSPSIPEPLKRQLADGGRLIIPVQRAARQDLVLVKRTGERFREEALGAVHFVPMLGRFGFDSTIPTTEDPG